MVAWDLALVFRHEAVPLGARADQAHLPHQHVPELGELVEAGRAQQPPDAGDARVPWLRVEVSRSGLDPHRPELEQLERDPVPADPGLREEDGPAVVELDRHGRPGRSAARKEQANDR